MNNMKSVCTNFLNKLKNFRYLCEERVDIEKKLPKYIFRRYGINDYIVQQCDTTRQKDLNVSFQVITGPFLCDEYF